MKGIITLDPTQLKVLEEAQRQHRMGAAPAQSPMQLARILTSLFEQIQTSQKEAAIVDRIVDAATTLTFMDNEEEVNAAAEALSQAAHDLKEYRDGSR